MKPTTITHNAQTLHLPINSKAKGIWLLQLEMISYMCKVTSKFYSQTNLLRSGDRKGQKIIPINSLVEGIGLCGKMKW